MSAEPSAREALLMIGPFCHHRVGCAQLAGLANCDCGLGKAQNDLIELLAALSGDGGVPPRCQAHNRMGCGTCALEYVAVPYSALTAALPGDGQQLSGCIACGAVGQGGYEVEDGPGPFCADCWGLLERCFSAALEREIAEARAACPSVRMQDHFDAPLLTLIDLEVSRGFNRDAEIEKLRKKLWRGDGGAPTQELGALLLSESNGAINPLFATVGPVNWRT